MKWSEEHSSIIAGLDLGTTKVCAVIAEQVAERPPRLIGMGQCPSEGMQRGAIVDAEKTVYAIGEAMRQAELMAGVEIDSMYAGISGEYIASLNSMGMVAVGSEGGWIGTQDRARVLAAAGVVKVPFDREVLHVLPQEFAVNGQRGILDPVGMYGVRLEASVHVVTSSVAAVRNIYHSILRAGVDVRSVVLGPLASSYAVLNEDEQQMGVCLLDIGGGTTDVAVFAGKGLRHSGIIGLGGQNVTNDIGVGLRTTRAEAERVKCTGLSSAAVAYIVEARMEEILGLARKQVYTALPNVALGAGIVLTGGGAQIAGAVALAERVFGMPVRLGVPVGFEGGATELASPPYATALGLLLYGADRQQEKNEKEAQVLVEDSFDSVLGRVKRWLQPRD
ncbi:MAG: cell division protein FtsA [Gemmatimonadota bacterium]|nr:cell division protein FtsA [Gemmatimonadota bacterium]